MVKVYVACEFKRIDEACQLGIELMQAGFDVVSTWMTQDKVYDPSALPRGVRDYLQVKQADILVYLVGKSVNANCEVGLAIGMGKPVFCIGEFSGNIFTSIPYLCTWIKDIKELKEMYANA